MIPFAGPPLPLSPLKLSHYWMAEALQRAHTYVGFRLNQIVDESESTVFTGRDFQGQTS